jgi:hypothetical protein
MSRRTGRAWATFLILCLCLFTHYNTYEYMNFAPQIVVQGQSEGEHLGLLLRTSRPLVLKFWNFEPQKSSINN